MCSAFTIRQTPVSPKHFLTNIFVYYNERWIHDCMHTALIALLSLSLCLALLLQVLKQHWRTPLTSLLSSPTKLPILVPVLSSCTQQFLARFSKRLHPSALTTLKRGNVSSSCPTPASRKRWKSS